MTGAEARQMATMLREQAGRSIAFSAAHGGGDAPAPQVALRVSHRPRGDFVRLWGRQGGPRGRVVRTDKASVIALFDARELVAAAERLEGAAEGLD